MSGTTPLPYDRDSEADTCRKEVLPKLYYSQWTDDLILEQRTFTDGMIQVIGRKARRGKARRYDYLLRYSQNLPLAIVKAKSRYKTAADGMQQAKEYAQILGLKFAYATNGVETNISCGNIPTTWSGSYPKKATWAKGTWADLWTSTKTRP